MMGAALFRGDSRGRGVCWKRSVKVVDQTVELCFLIARRPCLLFRNTSASKNRWNFFFFSVFLLYPVCGSLNGDKTLFGLTQ